MHLVNTDDFETVKGKYIDVIENTPDIEKYARWIYGKHPTDESLKAYIDRGEMYVLTDGFIFYQKRKSELGIIQNFA